MQDEAKEGENTDLARWLEDSGRRRATRLSESPEALLRYLEELTGAALGSREDIRQYLDKLKVKEAELRKAQEHKRTFREAVLLVLLGLALGHYYYWSLQLQIDSLQKIFYFVPASITPAKHSQQTYAALLS